MNKSLTSIAVLTALMTACGGGGGDNGAMPPAPANFAGSDVPVAATQDPNAAVDFVASVTAAKSESADPLVIGDARLATSETDEPKPQ